MSNRPQPLLGKLGIGIGARVVERLAARLLREGKIRRQAYQKGHRAGEDYGIDEVLKLWRRGMTYEQAKKELGK